MVSVCTSRILKWNNFPVLRKSIYKYLCKQSSRNIATPNESYAICFSEYGDPRKVLESKKISLSQKLENDQVLVKMLMAPINPSDINMIGGTYHIRPKLPAISGNEGVGQILEVGSSVTNFKPGDWVLPADSGWGTWRTHAVTSHTELQQITNDIPVLSAATIMVNPCTAYRILKDFVCFHEGDSIIQNAANSGVGQCVIQLAKEWNIPTINIVRNRPDIDDLVCLLKDLGATHVVTEEFCRTNDMKDLVKSLPKPPKLAINCVGGQSSTELLRHLGQKGVMVTVGGMSKKPIIVPTGALIFKQLKLAGYWNSEWRKENKDNPLNIQMIDDLCDLIRECKLIPPSSDLFPIQSFKEAVSSSLEDFKGKKKVLVMEEF